MSLTHEDGKNYLYLKNEGESQHFAKDEIYLVNDEETTTEYTDKHGYDEVEELLYLPAKQGYYVGIDENFYHLQKKGQKYSGAKAKKYVVNVVNWCTT